MHHEQHETRSPEALLTSLLANYQTPEDLIGENGLLKQLTKLLVEKALNAEMANHLGHDKHQPVVNASGKTRNCKSKKTLKGAFTNSRSVDPGSQLASGKIRGGVD